MSSKHNVTLEELRLDIRNHGGPSTCIGYAASKDRRCQRQIAGENECQAAIHLSAMTSYSKEKLETLARLCLCGSYNHREQASRISRAWLEEVQASQDKAKACDGHAGRSPNVMHARQFHDKYFLPRDDYSSANIQERVHGLGERTIKRAESRDEQARSRPIFENGRRAGVTHDCRERELENKLHDLQAWNSRLDNGKNEMRKDLEAARATVTQLQSQLAAALQSNTGLRDQLESEQRRTFTYEKEQIATSIESKDLRAESQKWRNLLEDEQRRTFMYKKEIIATGIETKDLRAKNHRLEQQMRQLVDEVSAGRRDAVSRGEREQGLARSFEDAKEQSLHRSRKLKVGYSCATEGEATQTESLEEEYETHMTGMKESEREADLREEQKMFPDYGKTKAAGLYNTCIWL